MISVETGWNATVMQKRIMGQDAGIKQRTFKFNGSFEQPAPGD